MHIYNEIVVQQRLICKANRVLWEEVDFNLIAGIANNLQTASPIHGLRYAIDENSSGWFLWSGDFSNADDFFKPRHLHHLIDIKPRVIHYLALSPGFRFLIDDQGYEDIWFDEALLLP